ncbi:MAG: DnaJ domain-containing protein [Clostridia bacterium]|nr:DnaJ domain-containing protein [Clostridia bacterium]
MVVKDYYKILGFENNKVNIDEIKNAYRDLAKKYHPDVNGNNPKAEERFKDIGEAYNILSNAKQKRKYDRLWNYYIGRHKKQSQKYQEAKVKDFMNLFFGEKKEEENNNKKDAERGENINTEITATISESFFGATKSITFKTVDNGSKKIDVKIPAGIRNNEKIRIIGQGKPGKNGGKNGDLFIKIKIKDNQNLRLQGIDLYTDLLISPWESALSTKITVQSIDEEIEVQVPKGTQSGDTITIPGKGYKDGKGGRGNLIAVVKIMMPKAINDEEIKLFKKLKEISNFNPRRVKNL